MSTPAALFRWLASPRTTFALGALCLAVLSAGMFVPQNVPLDAIGHSYPSSWTQVIGALNLHRIGASWLLQLSGVLLLLNLMALLLARSLKITTRILPGRGPDVEHGPVPGPPDEAPDAALAAVIGRWSVRRSGPNAAVATRGMLVEGLLVLTAGVITFLVAWGWSYLGGTRGSIELMEGDDSIAQSYFAAREMVGDKELPWRPGFQMSCLPPSDGTLLGTRECRVTIEGEPKRVTLTPGHDIEFSGLRLTLVGVHRAPDVAGFDLTVETGTGLVRVPGQVAAPLDIETDTGGQRIGTIVLSGTSADDPVGAFVPQDGDLTATAATKLRVRPRAVLTLAVASTQTTNLVWGGLTLVLLGLFLAGVLPSYRLEATQRGAAWRLQATGRGLLARPDRLVETVANALAGRVKAS